MYLPVIENNFSKTTAMLLVFFVSAVIHEYIIAFAMKFFYPILLIMFGGAGVCLVPLTRIWVRSSGANTFFWAMLFIGQGVLLVLYSREWYAQYNTTQSHKFNYDPNSYLPKSWQLMQNASNSIANSIQNVTHKVAAKVTQN